MNPLLLELLPLVRQGYCCSQLLVVLLLQSCGQENTGLVRAMEGLCHGIGGSEGPCGLLTGGACVLGCIAGHGTQGETAHPSLVPLLHDYQQWFAERTASHGGIACFQVQEGLRLEHGVAAPADGEEPDFSLCGHLLVESWEKLCSLLDSYDIPLDLP